MRERGWGRVVNIVSLAAKQSLRGLILSNVARPGVLGLAKSMSVELAPYGITVNSVCPGLILTDRVMTPSASLIRKLLSPGRPWGGCCCPSLACASVET
jgi:3-oxoacyl-[acyl-carrier protein] reductase